MLERVFWSLPVLGLCAVRHRAEHAVILLSPDLIFHPFDLRYIDRSGSVDDDGFAYAFNFTSQWKSQPST